MQNTNNRYADLPFHDKNITFCSVTAASVNCIEASSMRTCSEPVVDISTENNNFTADTWSPILSS